MTIYLPCLSGISAVRARRSPPRLQLLWSSGAGGGPPIVAAGLIWTIGQNGTLYGLNPVTSCVQQQATIGVPANHFPTPSVGDGLLLAPSARNVIAFTVSGHGVRKASRITRGPSCSQSLTGSGLGIPLGAVAGITVTALVAMAGLGWFLWRRRIKGADQ
jgi:hypothetical protein